MITFDSNWSIVSINGVVFFGGGFSAGSPTGGGGGFGEGNYSPARRRRLWRKRHRR